MTTAGRRNDGYTPFMRDSEKNTVNHEGRIALSSCAFFLKNKKL